MIVNNVRLCDPASGRDEIGWLRIKGGVIAEIGEGKPAKTKSSELLDGKGAVLAPGLIDMRVQSRNPGHAHQESRDSLAQAAAAGGITSLVCLPNTQPVLDNPDSLTALTEDNSDTKPRLYAYGAATQGLKDTAMAEIGLLAEAGAVGFTNGTISISNSLIMRRIMDYSSMLGKPVIQHAEDPALAQDGEMNESEMSTRLGLRGIPNAAEEIIIARDLTLARLTGCHYHVAHVSTEAAINLIRDAKAQNISVSCDTAPPYYMLNDLAAAEYDTRFQLSPPLRSESDRVAILNAIKDGTIDSIASDHAPHDRDAKLLPFGIAARGASALETLLPMVIGLYTKGEISLLRALEMVTLAPAKLLDLPGGNLALGEPADLVLFDPKRTWKIKGSEFHSLGKSTPFEGQPAEGVVLGTWVGGERIFSHRDKT